MKPDPSESRLSKPIVVISLASIIIGIAIMLVSVSIVTGFQDGIRDKVIGFGSHIQVTNYYDNSSMESSPLLIEQDFYPDIVDEEDEVEHIQIYAYKPAILQSKRDSIEFEVQDSSVFESSQDILGVLFKGVDQGYNWSFFEDKLTGGRIINFDSSNSEIVISKFISEKMGYKVGDEISSFFIMDNGPKKRTFEIVGIYDTGFEEFDKKLILTQIQQIQKLNNWGVQTFLTVSKDTCIDKKFVLKALTVGGSGLYKYKWSNSDYYSDQDYMLLDGRISEELSVISTDFERNYLGNGVSELSVPDTARVIVKATKQCECNEETLKNNPINFLSAENIETPFGHLTITNGKGSSHLYAGGFEIILKNWESLDKMDEIIDLNIPGELSTKKITDMHKNIFAWLDFLDINILIIIVLLLIVSLINMVTSLLVMILDKSNMIGVLKALGATDKSIRKIFLINSIFLLSRGLLWGNILGLGIICLQYFTGFISLNPEVYYLDTVPVNFSLTNILLINLITIIICRLTLAIPSLLIKRIDPIKAIRFD